VLPKRGRSSTSRGVSIRFPRPRDPAWLSGSGACPSSPQAGGRARAPWIGSLRSSRARRFLGLGRFLVRMWLLAEVELGWPARHYVKALACHFDGLRVFRPGADIGLVVLLEFDKRRRRRLRSDLDPERGATTERRSPEGNGSANDNASVAKPAPDPRIAWRRFFRWHIPTISYPRRQTDPPWPPATHSIIRSDRLACPSHEPPVDRGRAPLHAHGRERVPPREVFWPTFETPHPR
jgi:hypothetical protein